MYDDEKTWKSHQDDWEKLVKDIKHYPKDVSLEQHKYRMDIIHRLVGDYANAHEVDRGND
jgi:hypothetical protein|tara:strand:+ start:5176 stop:5355 length:180 start_codon:yes stop_codon:yes gene_type:complete